MLDAYADKNVYVLGEDRDVVKQTAIGGTLKRIVDVAVAAAMIVVIAPLMAALAAVIMIKDGAPVFFRHERIGHRGERIKVLKFRTMRRDSDEVLRRLLHESPEARESWLRDQKIRNDPRVLGWVGNFLRKTSLDELPQIFNVLRGEMSLVGPRPIVDDEVHRYGAAFREYLMARPGITGPWQISGRNDISYDSRVALDEDYVRNWSLFRDFGIMIRTGVTMLTGRGAY